MGGLWRVFEERLWLWRGHDPSRHGHVAIAGPETFRQLISRRQRVAPHSPDAGSCGLHLPRRASQEGEQGRR